MLTAALSLLLLCPAADPVEADVVIKGAILHDGTGQPGKKGDLAIKGERIVGVGTFEVKGKPRVIDGTGLIVASICIRTATSPSSCPAARCQSSKIAPGPTSTT